MRGPALVPGPRRGRLVDHGLHRPGGFRRQRQPEVRVDRGHRAERVRHEVGVPHVAEPRLVVPGAGRGERRHPAGPQIELIGADHGAVERRGPARGRLRGQAARRSDRRPGRPVGHDHQRVRVDREQRVQCEQVARVLQDPAPRRVVQADQLQVAAVPLVRGHPVLLRQPGRVRRQVGQALERRRPERLPQQLPALFHLVRAQFVHAQELRPRHRVLDDRGRDHLIHRVRRPGVPGRPGLRHLRQPQLQPLVSRIGDQEPVQRRRPGPGQAGDHDGLRDRHRRRFRVSGPAGLRGQPGHQRPADLRPGRLHAVGGQRLVPLVGRDQRFQPFAEPVGPVPVVRQPGQLRRRLHQLIGRPDVRHNNSRKISGGIRRS